MPDRAYTPPTSNLEHPSTRNVPANGPVGLGGWLILVIIGLIVSPLRIAHLLITEHLPLFTDGTWSILTEADSPQYHPLWGPLLVLEGLGNLMLLALCLTALALVMLKSRRAPAVAIGMYAFNLIFVAADLLVAGWIPAIALQYDPENTRELIRSLVAAVIWIPYFLVSKRVRNTFVR